MGISKKPKLHGKRVVLTRASHSRRDLIQEALVEAGAEVITLPLITIESTVKPEQCVDVFGGIATYSWVVFSSSNGVNAFFEAFFRAFKDIRSFGPARIACVGKQTAAEVANYHLEVELIPEESTGLALAKALVKTESLPSAFVLWVCGDKVNQEAVKLLEGKGEAILDVFPVYESRQRDLQGDPALAAFCQQGADAVLFASPSAAESFVKQAKLLKFSENAVAPKSISLGPTTSAAMKKLKLPLHSECAQTEPEAVVRAITQALGMPSS
jgi:uroporphyrinogen-III synthase